MSGFKRYQSKVFWNQMESRDVGTTFPASPALPRTNDRLFHEDNLDSVQESDTSAEPENVTVIHIEMCDSPAVSEEPSNELAAGQLLLAERSFSPASRGQRSQDSGFSDSGRSDSSGASRSPRRRRKRRSSRRRTHPRIAGLRLAAVDEPEEGPAHTSTPKQDSRHRLDRNEAKELSRQLEFSDERKEEGERVLAHSPSVVSGRRETLEDFLYASEPAEECGQLSFIPENDSEIFLRLPRAIPASEGLDVRAPVKLWLEEIRSDVEDECMATLQSKSLPKRKLRDEEPESRDLRLLTASAATAAKKVIDAADRFEKKYQRVFDSIGNSKSSRSEREALQALEAEALEVLLKFGSTMPRRLNQQENPRNLAMQLARLKHSVDRAFDKRLDFYIEKVVLGLEEAPRESGSAARGALAALTALGLAGPRAGASVARCSGIRALLTSLVSAGRLSSELRSASLRALGSVCCCVEAVDQFVREGGPEILSDILVAESTPETEKSEAAALVVQITAPWMDYVGLPYVEPFAQELIGALTDLAESTSCKQTLLLSTAAINHMAHSRRCIGPIVKCDSIKKLLRCVKKTSNGNVWLMEQVASLVGQVARVPQARAHLAETRASVALVCFLRMQPPGLEAESYRRLETTAAEALTRLCVDPEIAKQVVAVGGSDCLPSSECSGQACGDRDDRTAAGQPGQQMFHSTKSLRVARKIAAEQIDMARMWDCSPR